MLQKHYQYLGRVSVVAISMMIGRGRLRVEWKLVVGCQGHVRMHGFFI